MTAVGHLVDSVLSRSPKAIWAIAARVERQRACYAPAVKREYERLHTESEGWSHEEVLDYQWSQLSRVLREAFERVPYYRKIFRELGINPAEIRGPADFARFPLLSKQELQENAERLLTEGIPVAERRYFTTSGSTGIPVGFYDDVRRSPAIERTFIAYLRRRVDYSTGARVARLRGTVIAGHGLWQAAPRENAMVFSSYRLTEEDMPALLLKLRRFKPKYIEGYPSSLGLLADYMREHEETPPPGIRAVLCASENVYDWQRARIETAFGCRTFSHYGQSERVCLAGECEHSTALHIVPHYGYTELIDSMGRPITEPGVSGEIVGTGFWTQAMPLIRYRTGDVAAFMDGFCSGCQRPHARFERIEGRLQEFVFGKTGRPVSMAAINMHSSVFDNVRQFRFYQDTLGKVELRILPKPAYSVESDEPRIRHELSEKLGPDLSLATIKVVDEIPLGASGKCSFLEQRLPESFSGISGAQSQADNEVRCDPPF